MFMVVYLMSFWVALGFNEWFVVWMGLELNMMSFVSMMYLKGKWEGVESLFSYFFIQGVSSGVFLVMVYFGFWIEFPLMMKIGGGPFFFWFPSVLQGINWVACFFLMTFQKLLPLFLLEGVGGKIVMIGGVIGLFVGVLGSFGQFMVKYLMGYSSVNHVGWMMASQMGGGGLWLLYFFMYAVLVGVVSFMFWTAGLESLYGIKGKNLLMLFVVVLGMGGIPPFLGFVMKWIVLEGVMDSSIMVSLAMIISSLIMIYVYCRLVYSVMVGGDWEVSWEGGADGGVSLFVMVFVVGVFLLPMFVWMF